MLTDTLERKYLARIETALQAAGDVVAELAPGKIHVEDNGGRKVVTELDRSVSKVLRGCLLEPGEGWLSEEDVDDLTRLNHEVVWVVDPLDGTREFVDGIPEWCISIGLVVEGNAVAGGIYNPATGELFVGAIGAGLTYNGRPVQNCLRKDLRGALVLASRQEYNRGDWARFEGRHFSIRPVGSIAYKLALVAAGLADATWTLSPKNEWDVAAGVALLNSAGRVVRCLPEVTLRFNQRVTLLPGLMAGGKDIWEALLRLLEDAGVAV